MRFQNGRLGQFPDSLIRDLWPGVIGSGTYGWSGENYCKLSHVSSTKRVEIFLKFEESVAFAV